MQNLQPLICKGVHICKVLTSTQIFIYSNRCRSGLLNSLQRQITRLILTLEARTEISGKKKSCIPELTITLVWKPTFSWLMEDRIVYTLFFNETAQRRIMVHFVTTEFELGSRDEIRWTNRLSYKLHCCAGYRNPISSMTEGSKDKIADSWKCWIRQIF